jgi:TDG/mug DNA glycosylase family protein
LLPAEYLVGRVRLRAKIRRYRPRLAALVGVTVYRAMCPERKGPVTLGRQDDAIVGVPVFVLPNPSGRNANYSYAEMLTAFRALGDVVGVSGRSSRSRSGHPRTAR